MALGPGKYDPLCSYVREQAKAECAIVIVLDGQFGNGFSAQIDVGVLVDIPELLRKVAAEIEASYGHS